MNTFFNKFFYLLFAIVAMSLLSACNNMETQRQKPSRDRGTKSQTAFGRPASWEGGIPGMTTNAPRQY